MLWHLVTDWCYAYNHWIEACGGYLKWWSIHRNGMLLALHPTHPQEDHMGSLQYIMIFLWKHNKMILHLCIDEMYPDFSNESFPVMEWKNYRIAAEPIHPNSIMLLVEQIKLQMLQTVTMHGTNRHIFLDMFSHLWQYSFEILDF